MYPCICSWNWTRYRVPAFDLSPYPLSVPLLASAARQSVGSSSPWAPGSASGLKAAFWPRRAPSSHPQVPYGWSRTPNITRKQKQLTQLIQFLSPHVRCAHFSCLHSTTHHPWFLLLEQLDYIQMPLFFVVTVYIVFIPFISLLGFLQEACFLLHNVLQRSKEPCCRYMSLRGGQLKKRTWMNFVAVFSSYFYHIQLCLLDHWLWAYLQFSFFIAEVFELTVVFIHLWWAHWLLSCFQQLNFGHLGKFAHFFLRGGKKPVKQWWNCIFLHLCSFMLQMYKHTWGRNWQRLLTWMRRALTSSSTAFWLHCRSFNIHRDWLFSACISLKITTLPPLLYLQKQKQRLAFRVISLCWTW